MSSLDLFLNPLVKPLMHPNSIRDFLEIQYEERTLMRPYIGDQLDYCIMHQHPQRAIAVKAATGTGKTWSVIHNVLPFAKRCNQYVLIITNRNPLNLVYKKEIAEITGIKNHYTTEGLQEAQAFDNAYIVNYQGLEVFLAKHRHIKFSYVICDECHYFINDSTFSDCTGPVLDMIPKEFASAVRIYISATIESVLPYITRAELYNYNIDTYGNTYWKNGAPAQTLNGQSLVPLVYKMDSDYSKISLKFFEDTNLLTQQLRDKPGKVLAFCDTIKECAKFVSLMGGGLEINSEFLKNHPDVLESLVKNEGFSEKCLATTSVFSNGNNIKQKDVRDVVITLLDQTEILQMAGRRRIDHDDPNDGFTLYIKIPKIGKIKQKLHLVYTLQERIQKCKKNEDYLMRLIKDGHDKDAETIRHVFYYNSSKKKYEINYLCEDTLYAQQHYLEFLCDLLEEKGSGAYCEIIANLFDKQFEESMLFRSTASKTEELEAFVKGYGFPLTPSELKEFCEDFMEERLRLFGLCKADNLGAGRKTPASRSINNRLSELGVNLEIVREDNMYYIKENTDEVIL